MSNPERNVLVWALALHRHPMSLSEYADQNRLLLSSLRSSYSEFRHLWVVGPNNAGVLSTNLATLETEIADAVFDETNPSDYLRLTEGGKLDSHSLCRIGFSLTYGSTEINGRSMLPLEDGGVRLTLQGTSASVEPETSVVLEFAEPTSPAAFPSDRNYRKLLETVATLWQCNFGGVLCTRYRQCVRGRDLASYAGQWLYYLPFPQLANCLPPDIHHEPFANGILIQTTPHMPDADNPADVAAGIRVRDVLDEFGLVNDATYAIEGWPPDREEEIYEQFISGAPANRKYAVHCINFDGYDSDRRVLLYAKLFRRLKRHPKEWGLRGWDGPVLNEAKRQVRAAAKAGGVQIEWHVGLEEPAHQVRQLLADYTDISERQLRVIYTPVEQALTGSPPP